MNYNTPLANRAWDVLLIGGASGTGKTSVSYRLARHFGVGITEVDDFFIVLERLTTPEQQPALHYWRTHPEAAQLSAEEILAHHVEISRVMAPGLAAVIADHSAFKTPVILEGDYVLPELVGVRDDADVADRGRVRAVFLYEEDEMQIRRNLLLREPEAGEQVGRARVSWLYGQWLREECLRYGAPAVAARPWDTLMDRVLAAIATP